WSRTLPRSCGLLGPHPARWNSREEHLALLRGRESVRRRLQDLRVGRLRPLAQLRGRGARHALRIHLRCKVLYAAWATRFCWPLREWADAQRGRAFIEDCEGWLRAWIANLSARGTHCRALS